jgi:PAS domain S-box-containing protein
MTRAEESPKTALAYVGSIVDTVREPLLVLDGALRVQRANRSFYRNFQMSPQDTEGRLLYDLGNGQWDIARLHTLLEEILPENTLVDDFEVEHDFLHIGRKVMLLNARQLRQEGAELILLAIEDVTERRWFAAQTQAFETRFTALGQHAKDHAIFTLDADGRVTSWNATAELVLGCSEAAALGQHIAFIFTPEDREQGLPEAELRVAREQGRAESERWHLRKGGERFSALGIVTALHDTEGRLIGFSKVLRDMSAWKHAEQALRESEERLRLAWRATREVIWDWDIERDQQRWNDAGVATFGWTDAVEAPQAAAWWTERVHHDDRQRVAEGFHRALDDRSCEHWEDEYRFLRSDGSVANVLDRGFIVRDASGNPTRMIGAMLDISARKAAEAERERLLGEVQVERDRLSALLASIRDEVWYTDPHGRFTLVNPAALDEFRLELSEPIDVQKLAASLEVLRPDGSPRPVEASPPLRALKGESVIDEEEIIRTPASGELRYRQVSATPVRGEAGQIVGSVAVVRDITKRKHAEEALREADRRKDAFLATLAHELRNPLAPIRTGLDLIRALRDDDAGTERTLQIMDRQLTHLVHLVDDLLDVSRISRGTIQLRKERLHLGEIIDAALEVSESGLGQGHRRLTVSVPPEPPIVECDRVRLVQIIANLVNNAVKATDAGGHIAVHVLPQIDRVEIRVQDNGYGISQERLTGIFDMFSQVEPGRGGGLGIGLFLVRSLVTLHGGTVRAESDGLGRGATFTVSLPLCSSVPAQPIPHQAAQADSMPGCRVLVVDDNLDITESLSLLLTTLKTEVRVAHDGAVALQICKDWSPTHVLMDLGMPGIDGFEAARRLCADHPDRNFRLVALSGWGSEEHRQKARDAGFDQHLVKPVSVAEIKALLSN